MGSRSCCTASATHRFFAGAFIYTDRVAPADIRHSAQTVFGILILGGGPVLGGMLSGWLADNYANVGGQVDYSAMWRVVALIGLAAAAFFWAFFRERHRSTATILTGMATPVRIEACVDTVESALKAVQGGADRVELCDNLADGGTTPSHGTLLLALERVDIPVFPIIRPRGGSFVHGDDELAVMRADIRHALDLGAPGVVFGVLTSNGDIDTRAIERLREDAGDMSVTFHRAIDVCRDPIRALDTLIRLGVDRVLTSGQRATAWEGRELIGAMVLHAGGRIVVMAGGGVDESNAADVISETGVQEIHVRATSQHREAMRFHDHAVSFRRALPENEEIRSVTDPERINAIRRATKLIERKPTMPSPQR